MQIGTCIFLIAAGAILKYAVNVDTEGFSINTAGVILMIAGAVGLLVSLFLATMANGRERTVERPVREREVR